MKKVQKIIGSAPEVLDTLAEIAKALGDDPNFAATSLDDLRQRFPRQNQAPDPCRAVRMRRALGILSCRFGRAARERRVKIRLRRRVTLRTRRISARRSGSRGRGSHSFHNAALAENEYYDRRQHRDNSCGCRNARTGNTGGTYLLHNGRDVYKRQDRHTSYHSEQVLL